MVKFNVPKIEEVESLQAPAFRVPSMEEKSVEVRTITINTPKGDEDHTLYGIPTLLVPVEEIRLSACPVTIPVLMTPKVVCCSGGEGGGSSVVYNYNYNIDDILWKGLWKEDTPYIKGSQVKFMVDGTMNTYIAVQGVPENVRPTNEYYWDLHMAGVPTNILDRLTQIEVQVGTYEGRVEDVETITATHVEDKDNPHSVTKSQIGLGSVDNTSDQAKPISQATQLALNTKVDKVAGKGLSSNDYTNEQKEAVDSIPSIKALAVSANDKATEAINEVGRGKQYTEELVEAERLERITQDAVTLTAAQSFADERDTVILNTAKAHAIEQDQALIAPLKEYTDTAVTAERQARIIQDATKVDKTTTINGQPLSQNITLDGVGILGYQAENIINKDKPLGYAGLNSLGLIDTARLPSYVDDVVDITTYNDLPVQGESGKIYIVTTAGVDPVGPFIANSQFRWTGSAYIRLVASPGTSDDVPEGALNKYYTDARVKTYADTLYSALGHSHTFASLTGKPTTLVGYGITDAQPLIAAGTDRQYYRGDKVFATLVTAHIAESVNKMFVTQTQRDRIDTMYGWGNHAGLYPTFTGVGATGTWGISIYGSSASISDIGNFTPPTGTESLPYSGLTVGRVYNNGYPTSLGNVINIKGAGESQLVLGWSGGGDHADNFIRSKRDVASTPWSEFAKIWTSANFNPDNYLGINSTANNATTWNSQTYSHSGFYTSPSWIMAHDGTTWRPTGVAGIQAFLGLGTLAYQNDVFRLKSPYTYPDGMIDDGTSAINLAEGSYTSVAMHKDHGKFGGYATTLTMSGYDRYGAVQISAAYNYGVPELAVRNFYQTTNTWNSWVRIVTEPMLGASAYASENLDSITTRGNNTYNRIGVHLRNGAAPTISLAIGDDDTGFNSYSDGITQYVKNGSHLYNMDAVIHSGNIAQQRVANLVGHYISGGYEAPNYFGGASLQLQMLNTGWGWSDTLWMSGYSREDVKLSNQLIFSKGSPRAGFRQQNYDSTVWGSTHEILHSGITSREIWTDTYAAYYAVVGQLAWKNYGNNHTIFDASQGTTPSGTACSNRDAQIAWAHAYPTLMGWDGAATYGVRVDSARVADRADSAYSLSGVMAGSDYFRISAGGIDDNGYLEIATADNGNEAIYVRQYNGTFATVARELTLLDGGGNASFPGNVAAAGSFLATGRGNDYNDGAFTANGNGSSIYPSYGFHQPGVFGGSLQMHNSDNFYFFKLGAVAYANITAHRGTFTDKVVANEGFVTASGDGKGYGFWDAAPETYGIFMGQSSAYGRISGESDNDYNIYYNCQGLNRGHVFRGGDGAIALQITPAGTFNSGWYRSFGSQGWYNETYGGGIYMEDDVWVRTYGGKSFRVQGVIRSSQAFEAGNYGVGLVGVYDAGRYQAVFSMGASYQPALDGTSLNDMHGIAWTHHYAEGQSKAGLSHQALFVTAGITQTAIGTGIWTIGNISAPSGTITAGAGLIIPTSAPASPSNGSIWLSN